MFVSGFRTILMAAAIAAIAAIAAAPVAALADPVDDLMRSVRSDLVEMDRIQKERDALVQQNVNDKVAYDAVKSSYDNLFEEAKSAKAQWDAQIEKRYAAFDGMVENWNRECGVNYVGELDPASYQRCETLAAELDPYVAQGRAAIKSDDDNWYATVMAGKISTLEKQEAGMDEYAARMQARFEQTNAMDDRIRALRSHALQQLGGLGSACEAASSIEAVKYCNAIDWDGAGRGAPTIEEVAPIALMWPG